MSSSVGFELQSRHVGDYVVMYEIDATDIGGEIFRLTPHADTGEAITWQNEIYVPFPIEGSGYERASFSESQPRPRIIVSNVNNFLLSSVIALGDMVGAQVTRKRTLARFLDDGPNANPNKHLPDDVYIIHRKVSQNKYSIEFELSTILNRENVVIPRGQYNKEGGERTFPGINRIRQ